MTRVAKVLYFLTSSASLLSRDFRHKYHHFLFQVLLFPWIVTDTGGGEGSWKEHVSQMQENTSLGLSTLPSNFSKLKFLLGWYTHIISGHWIVIHYQNRRGVWDLFLSHIGNKKITAFLCSFTLLETKILSQMLYSELSSMGKGMCGEHVIQHLHITDLFTAKCCGKPWSEGKDLYHQIATKVWFCMIQYCSLVPAPGISVVFFWLLYISQVIRETPAGNALSSESTMSQRSNEPSLQVGSLVSPLQTGHWQGGWLLIANIRSTPIHCFLYSWEFMIPVFHSCNPKMNNFLELCCQC